MNPGEPIQFQCGECQVIFTLTVDGLRDTEYVEESGQQPVDFGPPILCPFCGDADVKAVQDGADAPTVV